MTSTASVTSLTAADVAAFARLGISAEQLERARIRRVTDAEARSVLSSRHPGNLAGILFPYLDPVTQRVVTYRLRRDHPELEDGKPKDKYLSAYGDNRHLYFPPGAGESLADTSTSVVIVEAEKSVLAVMAAATRAADVSLVSVGTGGCWGWRGRRGKVQDATGERVDEVGPLPDLDRITWTARDAIVCFDSNFNSNPRVQAACRALSAELAGRGAHVRIAIVPAAENLNGPDDLIALRGDGALFEVLDAARSTKPTGMDRKAAPERRTTFSKLSDGYRLVDHNYGFQLDVTQLRRERHDLICELVVSGSVPGARTIDGILSTGKYNLSSTRERRDEAGRLDRKARTGKVEHWAELLEELCMRTLAADRAGEPAVLLHTLPRPTAADALDVEGLRLFRDHPVIIFGDGGVLKSYIAVYFAGQLARRGLNVLFADWELAGDDHRDRLERIFGADMPPIYYARCDRPMVFEADRLARLKHKHGIDFLVCDSVGFGADGPPENADVAMRYFQSIRRMAVGSLNLAHTNRSEKADEKPFGSAYWHNSARATWYAKRAESTALHNDRVVVGLYNKKANLGPLLPAVGYEFTFSAERTEVRRVDVSTVDDLAAVLPIWVRVKDAVKRLPKTLDELADELGEKPDSIEKAINRKRGLFTNVTVSGCRHITLVERRFQVDGDSLIDRAPA